jgi:SAM-dependent methyltransferase
MRRGLYIAQNLVKNAVAPVAIPLWRSRGGLGADGDLEAVLELLDMLAPGFESLDLQVEGTRVLELGPGRTPEVTATFVLAGAASATGLDVVVQVPTESDKPSHYGQLAEALADGGADRFLAALGSSPDRVWKRYQALQQQDWPVDFQGYDGTIFPIEDSSVDIVVSKSVLEHIPRSGVTCVLSELSRVLSTRGGTVHYVDLRDHMHILSDSEVEGDWLDALRYSPRLFDAMFSNRSTSINRLRAREWRGLIEDAGLEVVGWFERRIDLDPSFSQDRLAKPWRDFSEEELSIGSVCLAARQRSVS